MNLVQMVWRAEQQNVKFTANVKVMTVAVISVSAAFVEGSRAA